MGKATNYSQWLCFKPSSVTHIPIIIYGYQSLKDKEVYLLEMLMIHNYTKAA